MNSTQFHAFLLTCLVGTVRRKNKHQVMEAITEKVFVLHVRQGYEDRAEHIDSMMTRLQIPFEYLLDGDICDLTPDVLDKYFKRDGALRKDNLLAQLSCAYKHLLVYERILKNNWKGALILEDDIILQKDFATIFNNCMREYEAMPTSDILISFENSRLRFVPRSQRVKGKYLYKGTKDRMTGAYYISNGAAKRIIDYLSENKCDLPIDLLHCFLIRQQDFPYYWCQPTIATQGSFTGKFHSSISTKKRLGIKISWKFKLAYKKLLYFLR